MPFPRDRFTRAGASAEQISELQDAYEALSPEAQESYDQRLAPLSDYQIVSELAGVPEPAPEEEEPEDAEEPEAESPAKPASGGQASSSPFPSQPSPSGSEGTK